MKLSTLMMVFCMTEVRCHPQCLDFTAPFNRNNDLSFCNEYKSYGCCGTKQEESISNDYVAINEYFHQNRSVNTNCSYVIKDLLCTRCHPYAAHLYDAENPPSMDQEILGVSKRKLLFPGLCLEYCQLKFDECRDWIAKLSTNPTFVTFTRKSTKNEFCQWAEIVDTDYCFPKSKKYDAKSIPRSVSRNLAMTPLCVEKTVSGLRNPLLAVHARDESHRLFIAEQRGIIRIQTYTNNILKSPFLNITKQILISRNAWDERGLLGLAFHPNYKENGRFFVYYSKSDGSIYSDTSDWRTERVTHNSVISEFTVSQTDPNIADPYSEIELLNISQPQINHNGGMLLFGKDGFLYIFVGDGGGAGDEHGDYGNGLNMSTLLGKVLRIDVDVFDGRAYAIPNDNPFIASPSVKAEIFAYGIRNIWKCSIDQKASDASHPHQSSRIFCGDVGQNAEEEIDIIIKGGNYGWRALEGKRCYDNKLCNTELAKANYVEPIITYSHLYGKSIVGGYVYRGCQNKNMIGKYIYGDTVSGRVFMAMENTTTGKWDSEEIDLGSSNACKQKLSSSKPINILSFGEDENGEIYILAATPPEPNKPGGSIYRITDPTRMDDPPHCRFTPRTPRRIKPHKRLVNRWDPSIKKMKKSVCEDKRESCSILSKYIDYCSVIERYARRYCKATCMFC